MLAEIAPNAFEDRRNRITITTHFADMDVGKEREQDAVSFESTNHFPQLEIHSVIPRLRKIPCELKSLRDHFAPW